MARLPPRHTRSAARLMEAPPKCAPSAPRPAKLSKEKPAIAGMRKASGASRVLYTALHLRAGTKEWYMQWLEREHPELVEKYRFMYYGTNAYAPKDYRTWLAAKIKPLIRKHGLEQGKEDPATGGVRSTTRRNLMRNADGDLAAMSPLIAEELPPATAARAITLF